MFLSAYWTKYLRDDTALMTLIGNKVFHRKAPQPTGLPYIAVMTAEDYDPGNISVGILTWKQEDFTMLVVGDTVAALQRPWKRLEELITACRNVHVTSTELGGTMHIQSILAQSPHMGEGITVDGCEITSPCLVVPLKGSFTLPVLTG